MRLNRKLELSRYVKLIVFMLCLLTVEQTFGQRKPPALIVSGSDTLVAITEKDFNTILFGFSYIRSLENTSKLTSKQLSKQDSINAYLSEVLTLERTKTAQKDSVIINLETIIENETKKKKREKLKNTLIQIGGALVIAAETGIITYLILNK